MTAMPRQVPGGDARASDDFMLVRPDLVRRVGNGNAALVYARIEFRCAQPGQDRIEDETGRWWRVTSAALSDETGLTVDALRRTMPRLEKLGEIESTKHRLHGPSDQTLSYRTTRLPAIRSNGRIHSVNRPNGRSEALSIDGIDSVNRPNHHSVNWPNVPPIEELEEGGAHARTEQASHAPTSEPPRRCPKHLHDENPPNCHACGQARRAHEIWQTEQLRAERQAASEATRARAELSRQQIDACTLCDADGYVGASRCHHDPNQADTNRRGVELMRATYAERKTR